MQADASILKRVEERSRRYRETWGQEVDYTVIPPGLTQEKLASCLELMIGDNISLVEAYTRLFSR